MRTEIYCGLRLYRLQRVVTVGNRDRFGHRTSDTLTYTAKAKYTLRAGVREFYYGCDPFLLPKILAEGLKPSL